MSFFAKRKSSLTYWLRRAWCEEQWCVGLIEDAAFWRCVQTGTLIDSEVQWLPASGRFFLADPCWVSEEDRLFVAECFHYQRRIGGLVLATVSNGTAVPTKNIKQNEVHHSYPMVYAFGDDYLIIPESAACNAVNAISIDRSGRVTKETPILSGYSLVDPTVFFHDGSYWMFANPLGNFDNELVVFRGEAVTGPWYKTSFSPLATPNCRGGGRIFEKDGVLYWPTQHNSHSYGGGLILRRIVSLTEAKLEHDIVSVVMPDTQGSRPLGFHSFSKGDSHHLVDGLRSVFSPLKPVDVLISRVRRRLRRSVSASRDVPTEADLAKGFSAPPP